MPPHRQAAAGVLVAMVFLAATGPGHAGADAGGIGATIRVSPLVIDLELSTAEARVGEIVHARATVANLGETAIELVVVTLRAEPEGVRVEGVDARLIRRIHAGRTASVQWPISATVPGSYVILAQASVGDLVLDSPARLLTARPKSRR